MRRQTQPPTQTIGRTGRVAVQRPQASPQQVAAVPGQPISEDACQFYNHAHEILDDAQMYEEEETFQGIYAFSREWFKDETLEFQIAADAEIRNRRANVVQRQQAESAAAAQAGQAQLVDEPVPPPAILTQPAVTIRPVAQQQMAAMTSRPQVNQTAAEHYQYALRQFTTAMTVKEQMQQSERRLQEIPTETYHNVAVRLEREICMEKELLGINKKIGMILEFANETEDTFREAHNALRASESSYLLAIGAAHSSVGGLLTQIMRKYESGPSAVVLDDVLSRHSHIVLEQRVIRDDLEARSAAPQTEGIRNAVQRVASVLARTPDRLTGEQLNDITVAFNSHFEFLHEAEVNSVNLEDLFDILSENGLKARQTTDMSVQGLLDRYHEAAIGSMRQSIEAIRRQTLKHEQTNKALLQLILNVSMYCVSKSGPCIMLAPLPDPVSDLLFQDLPFLCRFTRGVSAMCANKSSPVTNKIHKRVCVLMKVVHDLCRLNNLDDVFSLDAERNYPVEPQVKGFMERVATMTGAGITSTKIRELIEWITQELTCPVTLEVVNTILSVPKDRSAPSNHHLSIIEASAVQELFKRSTSQTIFFNSTADWRGIIPDTRKEFRFNDVKRPSRSLTAIHIGVRLMSKKRSSPPQLDPVFAPIGEFGQEKHEEVDAYRQTQSLQPLPR